MENGYSSKYKNHKIITSNTCLFDSIVSFFAVCNIDLPQFSEYIKFAGDQFSGFIRLLFDAKNEKNIYITRNYLLNEYYKNSENRQINEKIINIDCYTGFDYLFEKICQGNDIFNSINEIKYCLNCKEIKEKNYKRYVPLDLSSKIGSTKIEYLERYFQPAKHDSKHNCDKCNQRIITVNKPGKSIMIEANLIAMQRTETQSNFIPATAIAINSIPNQIEYDAKSFKIKCIIERTGQNEKDGHFIAYVKRHDDTWQIYDDMQQRVKTIKSKKKIQAVIVCYVNGN